MSGYLARLAVGARSLGDAHPRWVSPYEGLSAVALDREPRSLDALVVALDREPRSPDAPVAHGRGNDSPGEIVVRPPPPEQPRAVVPSHREPDATVRGMVVEPIASPNPRTGPRVEAEGAPIEQVPPDPARRKVLPPAIAPAGKPEPMVLAAKNRPRPDDDHAPANQVSSVHRPQDTGVSRAASQVQITPRPLHSSLVPTRVSEPAAVPESVSRPSAPPLARPAAPHSVRHVAESGYPRRSVPAAERAEAAPTVVVTIGRLEVRAASPPPPALRPRSAPVPMSLETYFARRDQRKP